MATPKMSKKLSYAVFAVLMIVSVVYFAEEPTVASSAISGIGLISFTYLGGQAGVDGVKKFKEQKHESEAL